MKYYLKNLLTALCGRNPYRQELDELKEEMEKARENVSTLQDAYYKEMEKSVDAERMQDEAVKLLEEYKSMIEKNGKQLTSFQALVENYRERLDEKNAMIEQIRKDYQRQVENYENRIGNYCLTIADLQKRVETLQNAYGKHATNDNNRRARNQELLG